MSEASAAESPVSRMRDAVDDHRPVGPILFCHGWRTGRLSLAALLAWPEDEAPPPLTADATRAAPDELDRRCGYRLLRYRFELPQSEEATYQLGDTPYTVNTAWSGDLQLAYVACNGQETGDRDRLPGERNALWERLTAAHQAHPLNLLMHGGDQLYADEMLTLHPRLRAWGKHAEHDPAPPPADLDRELQDYLFRRYLELYSQPPVAWLMARVPSVAIWDDHDICDGWGSRPEAELDAPVGRLVFQAARAQYLHFQMAASPEALPPLCADTTGETLSWWLRLPGVRIVAPDLRSERRPRQVLGQRGWAALECMLAEVRDEHVLVLSSVPAMGPRLSWVEGALKVIPHAQKYEDDLRDQWQSRVHRSEWQRFLEALAEAHQAPGGRVTVLSGEIHLATRAAMTTPAGDLHQLVSSGISHPPPPRLYARALGALARLGESPLPACPIRLEPLPGQRGIYTAERNYLLLQRRNGRWSAHWELEHGGATAPVRLDCRP